MRSSRVCRAPLPAHKVPATRAGRGGARHRGVGEARASRCVTSSSPAAAAASASASPSSLRHPAFGSSRSRASRPTSCNRRCGRPQPTGMAHCISTPSIWPTSPASPAWSGSLRGKFGAFYGLVNNAGLGTAGMLANMPDSADRAADPLNTISPILLTKYVARSMMTGEGGRIVNISSIVGIDRLQRPVGLQRDQGLAGRLHALAGARARPARHHRQRRGAGLHRYRDDPRADRRRSARRSRGAAR